MDSMAKPTQLVMGIVLTASLSLAVASVAESAETTIENEFLRVFVNPEQSTFRLAARQSGKVFVRQGRFAHEIKTAKRTSIYDPVWRQSRGIEVEHKNGWQSTLRLFPNSPFVQLHTTVYNSSSKPYVSACEEILQFQVNLGLPPGQLRSYGTGFLNPLEDAPGSFSFTCRSNPFAYRNSKKM